MATTKFKTKCKVWWMCSGNRCKAQYVRPRMTGRFELTDPNKVLEVKVDLAPATVIAAVKEAGFKAEQL